LDCRAIEEEEEEEEEEERIRMCSNIIDMKQ